MMKIRNAALLLCLTASYCFTDSTQIRGHWLSTEAVGNPEILPVTFTEKEFLSDGGNMTYDLNASNVIVFKDDYEAFSCKIELLTARELQMNCDGDLIHYNRISGAEANRLLSK